MTLLERAAAKLKKYPIATPRSAVQPADDKAGSSTDANAVRAHGGTYAGADAVANTVKHEADGSGMAVEEEDPEPAVFEQVRAMMADMEMGGGEEGADGEGLDPVQRMFGVLKAHLRDEAEELREANDEGAQAGHAVVRLREAHAGVVPRLEQRLLLAAGGQGGQGDRIARSRRRGSQARHGPALAPCGSAHSVRRHQRGADEERRRGQKQRPAAASETCGRSRGDGHPGATLSQPGGLVPSRLVFVAERLADNHHGPGISSRREPPCPTVGDRSSSSERARDSAPGPTRLAGGGQRALARGNSEPCDKCVTSEFYQAHGGTSLLGTVT